MYDLLSLKRIPKDRSKGFQGYFVQCFEANIIHLHIQILVCVLRKIDHLCLYSVSLHPSGECVDAHTHSLHY